MNLLTTGLDEVMFKDLLTTTKDGDWGKSEPTPDHLPYRVIRGTDFSRVREGDLSTVPLRYLPERTVWRRTLEPFDVLIETAGGTSERPTGRSLLVTQRILDGFDAPATCASFARFLRIDPEIANPAYVFWHLQDLYQRDQMRQHEVRHTGVGRFQYTDFASTHSVRLPPQAEQRGIAATLGAFDEKIESNRRAQAYTQELIRSLVTQTLAVSDPGGATLGDYCSIVHSTAKTDDLTVDDHYIALEHMPRGSIFLDTWESADGLGSNKSRFRTGDVLFGKLRPYFKKVGVAPLEGVCSTDILVLRPVSTEYTPIVAVVASSDDLINSLSAAATGTRMPRASAADVSSWPVPRLEEKALAYLADLAVPLLERGTALTHEIRRLTVLRDALLPELLSGRIRVPEAQEAVAGVGA